MHAVTASATTPLMHGQLRFLCESGCEVVLLSSPGEDLADTAAREGVRSIPVPMEREIAPLKDLGSLWRLWRVIRQVKPTLVNVGTAKAGLLGGLAAWLARVPCRVYTIHGLRLETLRGLKRWILVRTERIACRCAHRVLCVSDSVRARAIELGLVDPSRAVVLGPGSFNGVDASRFAPTPERIADAAALREQLDFPQRAPVIGFVGRLTRDKGIPELMEAFAQLRLRFPEARLLVLGRYEAADPIPQEVRQAIEADPHVFHAGHVSDPSVYYQVMDLLVLPTYREGFPTVVLEASAAGKPVVATRATGARDAVVDGVTGLLVPVGDAPALAEALARLLADPELARTMGRAGQQRVAREFSREQVCARLAGFYHDLMEERGLDPAAVIPAPARAGRLVWRLGRPAKRLVDICGAALGLVLTLPIMALAAAAIRLTMGPPVLFRQRRTGRRGCAFTLHKFRTMTDARDPGENLLANVERLTPVGRLLRRFSVDEFPQLWNVLKGDMSLVGPRPLLPEYLPAYTPREQLRHAVRPGITGWAQVNGRNSILFSQRLELDAWYVENWTPWLDLRILLVTIPKTLCFSGVAVCQDMSAVDDRGFRQVAISRLEGRR